jgi:hypothetical protein
MSIVSDYQRTLDRRRADRAYLADEHRHRSREYWRLHDEQMAAEARRRQRLQDVCEDGGLVFCLPSLNPYSGE